MNQPAPQDVLYAVDGPIARITLNRPKYRNAQSWRLLDQLDEALDRAMEDPQIRVAVVDGAGGNFSSGHDLGTAEQVADQKQRGVPNEGLEFYDVFRKYNLDYTIKWRNLPKATIAMVEGYCIFGGWMIAAAMDLVFASTNALFLPSQLEYFSVPWDIHPKKAKELLFEFRFADAQEAKELGFANRVYEPEDLERETLAYARRVAENTAVSVRLAKVATNRAQDLQGYSVGIDAAFADFMVTMNTRGPRPQGQMRLGGVDLALKGLKKERYGQK
ncbi:MAG: enoyl-CoA hydratase-related protein [Acidobacteriota bacterium]|nr:enoyl-CoA hydratase-related protein [Acidobacteriota bacterium]